MRFSRIVVAASLITSGLGCGSADSSAFDDPGSSGGDDTGSPVADSGGAGVDAPGGTDGAGGDTTKPLDSGAPAFDSGAGEDTFVGIDGGIPDAVGVDVPISHSCTVPSAKVFAGHCYFRIEARSFTEAKAGCATFSATTHLVTIGSDGEQKVAASLGVGLERWIGLNRDFTAPAVKASYKWITGEATTFEDWAPGEPNGTGSCVRLLPDDTWADRDCTNALTSICEEE